MTPEQIQRVERTLNEAKGLLHRIHELRSGVESAGECELVEIQFSPHFTIAIRRKNADEMTKVCWAKRELEGRAHELRMALIEVVKSRLAILESELDALALPEGA